MDYTLKLSTNPSLRPNAEAAKRLAQKLREIRASKAIIEVAEKTVEAAERESGTVAAPEELVQH